MILNGPVLVTYSNKNGELINKKICKECEDGECKCFGIIKHTHWKLNKDLIPTHLSKGSIKILYRDKIKVFYPTVTAAKKDGYTDYNPHIFTR
jgi:hypothetical protein